MGGDAPLICRSAHGVGQLESARSGPTCAVQYRPEQRDRRCYALGAMVDQYLSSIFLSEDPNVIAVAGDIDTIAATLDDIWWRTLSAETDRAR